MIEITSEAMERAEILLEGIPKGAERAFSNAVNRGLSHARTKAYQEVRKVYAVKQSDLNAVTATRVQNASTGNIAGYVSFSGVKLPLYKFNVSQKAPKKSKNIKAGLMKGSWTAFENAFIAQMNSGHIGIFERTGEQGIKSRLKELKEEKRKEGNKHTEKVEEIMGLSGAQMVQNEVVIDQLSEEAQQKVNERVMHEIDRILNGYGG